MRRPLVALFLLIAVAPADATDQPISGAALSIKTRSYGQLQFSSKDPAFLFPVAPTDNPATNGATIEVLSTIEQGGATTIPPGFGKPGWDAQALEKGRFVFRNGTGTGISIVKKFTMKPGKQLQLTVQAAFLGLSSPPTRVAIRITTGALRSCAVFEGASIRKNEPGRFLARNAPAPAIADCSDNHLLGLPDPTPTPRLCGTTAAPTCDGECPPGDECVSLGFGQVSHCGCIPAGSTPCGTPGIPTCGGACDSGRGCGPVFVNNTAGCYCTTLPCPNGTIFYGAPGITPGCYPNYGLFCANDYPTCGGPCGDGGTCIAFSVTSSGFSECLCAVPGPCGAGGYDCPPGEVCHLNGASTACGPP